MSGKKRNFFYDTEFLEDGETIELVSIGMVDLDGREFYAENLHMPMARMKQHPWIMRNVIPHLNKRPDAVLHPEHIADDIVSFLADSGVQCRDEARLWGYYSAYDHVLLAQMFGRMIDLPQPIPMFTCDLMQVCDLAGVDPNVVPQVDEHDALADARWNRDLYLYLTKEGLL